VLAVTNIKWLGAITPVGGISFMVGWAWLMISAGKSEDSMKKLICIAAVLVQFSFSASAWIADNGNGTYSNPLFYEGFSLQPESGGGFVSVPSSGGAVEVKLRPGKPGDAETFQWEDLQLSMNRNAEQRLGAGKAALKPPALQTLRVIVAVPYCASASGVRAALAPLSLSREANPRFRGSKSENSSYEPRTTIIIHY
jgi:hypothetical protein